MYNGGMAQRWVNPFQITKPVDAGEVIDRADEARQLVDLAEEGNNARLVAPRRFGKTSLLNLVQGDLADTGLWTPVYVDLLGITTQDDFANRIESAYTKALRGKLANWFAAKRRSLKPTITAGGGPLPASAGIDLSGPSQAGLVSMLGLPAVVAEKTEKRVHVVFDEFQELLSLPGQVDSVVRSVIQHHAELASYVFAGSQIRMMEQLFTDPKRAFFSQTQRVTLPPISAPALGEYVTSRFDSTDRTVTAEALGALLDLTDGHPQRAMVAAHALWNACDTNQVADIEQWGDARTALMEEIGDELRTTWLGLPNKDRATIKSIATGAGPYNRSAGSSRGKAVADSLDRLEGKGMITKRDGSWHLVDPLLAAWLTDQQTES
jgi:hypothetical protein